MSTDNKGRLKVAAREPINPDIHLNTTKWSYPAVAAAAAVVVDGYRLWRSYLDWRVHGKMPNGTHYKFLFNSTTELTQMIPKLSNGIET